MEVVKLAVVLTWGVGVPPIGSFTMYVCFVLALRSVDSVRMG